MTDDEILDLAADANSNSADVWVMTPQDMIAFARGIAAKEREACAKVCEVEASVILTNATEHYQEGRSMGATVCANAIRARGE